MTHRSYEIDMLRGSIFKKVILFAYPLALSGMLQLLFTAADTIVVGRFVGPTALAAVGSTGSLINRMVNLLIGLSVGANVSVAKAMGARDYELVSDSVHSSVFIGAVTGTVMIVVGWFLAHPLLGLMGSPEDVIDQATLYMQIYFVGMPASLLYNFGSAVLRAVGDTRRPMYILILAGFVNFVLNMLFVLAFGWEVAGVALATILSQIVSAVMVIICLIRADGPIHLNLRELRLKKKPVIEMLRVGLPAGIQGTVFNISNVLIQSTVNSFGSVAMAGNAAAGNLEGFVGAWNNSFYQASLSFTSQCYGAKQYERIRKIKVSCLILVFCFGFTLGGLLLLASPVLLQLYNTDPEVIRYGIRKLTVVGLCYGIGGMMDVMVGCLRGIGYSIAPMIVSLTGACAFRVIYILTIFQANPTWEMLFLSYPISWSITFLAHFITHTIVVRKLPRKNEPLEDAAYPWKKEAVKT